MINGKRNVINKRILPLCMGMVISAASFSATAVFEQAHGQRFLMTDTHTLGLSQLTHLVADKVDQVVAWSAPVARLEPLDTHLLIISGPFMSYTEAERASIVSYVNAGGRLLIALHVGPINGALLRDLGVDVANGSIRANLSDGSVSSDFVATPTRVSQLSNPAPVAFYGAWPLRARSDALGDWLLTPDSSWVELNRNNRWDEGEPMGRWSVMVAGELGRGKLAVLGDDALLQNQFLTGNNLLFAEQLIDWLLD